MSLHNQEIINNISPDLYDDEFIRIINGLNESIKEYYKVSKHNVKETNNFLLLFEDQFKKIETSLNEISQNMPSQNINGIFQKILQSKNIVDQLQKNSKSNDKNLNLFFQDAKTLFKKMKLKRNESLMNFRRSLRSQSTKRNNKAQNSMLNSSIFTNSRMNYNNNNKNNHTIKTNNIFKILRYINQLKDYNEIIGKFSVKAKYNFINLQKMIFNAINDEQIDLNLDENQKDTKNDDNNLEENTNTNTNTNMAIDNNEVMNIFEVRNKYEKEISNLNNKIKDLIKRLNENQDNNINSRTYALKKKNRR